MTDQLCGIEIAKVFDHPLTTIFVCVVKLAPEGPATILLLVVLVCCTVAVPIVLRYYAGLVGQGAAPEGSLERQDYDKLRASLNGGNLAARLYAKWLTAFLDWIERFFGDAGMADRTLFPRAFGLKTPTPLWTAPAFDRCLLLALIYPIATIFAIWAISGHVGPAEAALGLQPHISGWSRSFRCGGHRVFKRRTLARGPTAGVEIPRLDWLSFSLIVVYSYSAATFSSPCRCRWRCL